MKLKLRVLDPKQKSPTIKDSIENKTQITNDDNRWNVEKEFEIPERFILKLVEEMTDVLSNEQFYIIDSLNRLRKRSLSYNEIEEIVRPTKAWKKIHVMISDQGYETSRFTRLSLFEKVIDNDTMKLAIRDKIESMEAMKHIPKIPEEKKEQPQPLPQQKNKVSTENVMEFISKSVS